MKNRLLGLACLCTVVVAATNGPDPVITIKGMTEAMALTPELRNALEPKVEALNAALERIAVIRSDAPDAAHERRIRTHEAVSEIHEIMKRLNSEQRAALHAYLHAALQNAGIPIRYTAHGEGARPSHGEAEHPDHGPRTHHVHGMRGHRGHSHGHAALGVAD